MKYIVNTWETLHCKYEVDAVSKENAFECLQRAQRENIQDFASVFEYLKSF